MFTVPGTSLCSAAPVFQHFWGLRSQGVLDEFLVGQEVRFDDEAYGFVGVADFAGDGAVGPVWVLAVDLKHFEALLEVQVRLATAFAAWGSFDAHAPITA